MAANSAAAFITVDGDVRTVPENSPAGTPAGEPVAASDADGDELVFTLSGVDEFTIDSSTGQIMVAEGAGLDYEKVRSYTVNVSVSDARNAQGDEDDAVDRFMVVTILVADVDEPPAKPGAPMVVTDAVSPTSGLTVEWKAPANTGPPIIGYDLGHRVAGTSDWIIQRLNANVTATRITGLASATTYEVRVRAVNEEGASPWSDSSEASTMKANSAPTFPSKSKGIVRSVAENSPAGTLVGDPVVSLDADGDSLTYTLTGDVEFEIDAYTGQIKVAPGANIDYETARFHSVTVSVSDGFDSEGNVDPSIDDTTAVTILVDDLDESRAVKNGKDGANTLNTPPSVTAPADRTYRQGQTIEPIAIQVSDPDAADTLDVSLAGLPDGLSYSGGTVAGTVTEFAAVGTHQVTISASDGVNAAVTASFNIDVEAGGSDAVVLQADLSSNLLWLLLVAAGVAAVLYVIYKRRRNMAV